MPSNSRIVVWIPSEDPGWELEESRPYETRSIGGGIRTLYELAAAFASTGREVELRGVVSLPALDAVCAAAGARPELPEAPRAPAATDTVIVPEGITAPEVHARLALSPARAVLMLLGPPGLIGWPFTAGWAAPDPAVIALDAVARPEHFRAAAGLGYELWTHTPGLQRAAAAAGVECRFIGNGVPGGYPEPARERDIAVLWLRDNRWSPLARPTVRALTEMGVECVAAPPASHDEMLDLFGRARVLLHPTRVEGHSRLGCEARGMGAVPAVPSSNSFAVGLDESHGALAVDAEVELADAIADLLATPDRLARMSAAGMRSAREQVAWDVFVERALAALAEPPDQPSCGARAAIGEALRERHDASELERTAALAARDAGLAELERHQSWLRSTNGSLSWRATRPLRAIKRGLVRERPAQVLPPPAVEPPRGEVVWPPPGSERARGPVDIHGWCLFPGSTVARVEVSLNGGAGALARIAVERPGRVPDQGHPDAPICGFEHKVDLAAVAHDHAAVRVDAVAHSIDGRVLALEPVTYPLAAAPSPPADLAPPNTRPPRRPPRRRAYPGIRLLAFTHTLGYGGGSLYLLELLRRLQRTAVVESEVVVLADGPLRALLEDDAMPVHVTDGNAAGSAARYEGHLAELVAWSRPRRFDAVLVNTLGAFAGADLAARLGIPAVWAIHESFPLPMFWFNAYGPGALDPQVRAQAERSLRDADMLLFVADATRDLFVADGDPARMVTLPYGIEHEAMDAVRRSLDRAATRRLLGIDENVRVVLCAGSIEPRKSQAMLVQAFGQVAERHPDAQLVLLGATEDGYSANYRAALREHVERAGLAERVRVEPVTSDAWSWHAVADLLVCASDIESLPRVVCEAMAFGTPVLSTRVFGVPELIDEGVNGFLCEMCDAGSLAAALDRVLSLEPARLATIARAGRERVRTRHDPQAYATGVLRLLETLVDQPAPAPRDLVAGSASGETG